MLVVTRNDIRKLTRITITDDGMFKFTCKKKIMDNLAGMPKMIDGVLYVDEGNEHAIVFEWYNLPRLLSLVHDDINIYSSPEVKETYQDNYKTYLKKKIADVMVKEGNYNLINGTLFDFQKEGVIFCRLNKQAILADDMGLGKTVQTIEVLLRDKKDNLLTKALLIVPASLKKQWCDEIDKFSTDEHFLNYILINGNVEKRKEQWALEGDVYIVNYETIINDIEYGFLKGMDFSHVILDEASQIKNYKTKRAMAIFQLSKQIPRRFALTGTPLENDIDELWSISNFVRPELFVSREKFIEQYGILKRSFDAKEYECSERTNGLNIPKLAVQKMKIDSLRQKLRRIMIRRRKIDVLSQLPPITKMREAVDMDPFAMTEHDRLNNELVNLLREYKKYARAGNNPEIQKVLFSISKRILAKFTYLRELCLMPELVLGPECRAENAKLQRLLEILQQIDIENKVVIFTEFRRVALMLNDKISNSLVVHGGVEKLKRSDVISEFKNSTEKNVLISTSVLMYGVNLQFASYVINYDLHFNPAKMAQRTDRLHRIGQEKGVTVINIVMNDTIEEKIEEILMRKHDLICSVVEGKKIDPNFMKTTLIQSLSEMID